MEETKKTQMIRKHPILDCPVVGPILIFLYGEIVVMLAQAFNFMAFGEPGIYFGATVVGLIMIAIHRLIFRGEYRGGLYTGSLGDKKFWILYLIVVGLDAACCVFDMVTNTFIGVTVAGIGSSLMAGICEETESRYLLISIMMRRYKDKNTYLPVLLFTALTFGFAHYTNLDSFAHFGTVTVQVLMTCASGFAMGAIFLRTGNIGLTIAWHFLHDLLCSMSEAIVDTGATILGVSVGTLIECGILGAVYIIFGILVLKGQKENIMKVWKNRWSETEEAGQ